MNETCTLIKNSELEKLQQEVSNCKVLIKETVDDKTAQLRNDISEKDKEIDTLNKTIEDMKANPQIDPMKMVITVENQIDTDQYDRFGGKSIRDIRTHRVNIIEPVNFKLSDNLQKQIQNIVNLFTLRDRTNILIDIDKAAQEKFSIWQSKYEDYTLLNFVEEGYFERKKIIKKLKEKYKDNDYKKKKY